MVIGDRLRELREDKQLSQGDIEKRTGLLRCYISRVENGHTVPAVETLEKLARALEIPLYQIFYEGTHPAEVPKVLKKKASEDLVFGKNRKEASYLHKLRKCLSKTAEPDLKIIMVMAQKMANGHRRSAARETKKAA
jgi:transcriptional regulator with XRE-family HTH domain